MSNKELGTIDSSINVLDDYIAKNQASNRKIMSYLLIFSMLVAMLIILPYLSVSNQKAPVFLYVLAGIYIVVFGVLMAVYRFHLNEIARATHYKIGFMRIRVAANNHDKDGFQTEVRQSLTDKAFDYNTNIKSKHVESPLPGHPTSDLSSTLLNKILDSFEIKKK